MDTIQQTQGAIYNDVVTHAMNVPTHANRERWPMVVTHAVDRKPQRVSVDNAFNEDKRDKDLIY